MSTHTTDDQTAVFVEAFKLIDHDGDGILCTKDLRSALASFGLDPTEDELRDILKGSIAEGEDSIDLDKFLVIMTTSLDTGAANLIDVFEL
ncbi:putative calmodulin variant 1 [Jimgerdemannia flammicorona]|uniref:Putative calmodulin variant 1 n=2 Tax=Jimgerdemannia flammicorona TaxID=994334 RepID=A0A433QAX4_9FUNG|nr:putative calmodulin variant 1 [Jimgerdemannia flammicorona]RUS26960.1 putative calmodulin variant 1 [Jimgerdemannia flammicorona]